MWLASIYLRFLGLQPWLPCFLHIRTRWKEVQLLPFDNIWQAGRLLLLVRHCKLASERQGKIGRRLSSGPRNIIILLLAHCVKIPSVISHQSPSKPDSIAQWDALNGNTCWRDQSIVSFLIFIVRRCYEFLPQKTTAAANANFSLIGHEWPLQWQYEPLQLNQCHWFESFRDQSHHVATLCYSLSDVASRLVLYSQLPPCMNYSSAQTSPMKTMWRPFSSFRDIVQWYPRNLSADGWYLRVQDPVFSRD